MSFVQTITFENIELPLRSQPSAASMRSTSRNDFSPRRTPNTAFLAWRSSATSSQTSLGSGRSSMLTKSSTKSSASSSGPYHHLGRPTKASLLRMKSCPVLLSEPDYQHIARRKREFVKHSKSMSATTIMENILPEGESAHAFLTGARYNSAQCVDSKSLARLGVYVSRGCEGKSFVNAAPVQREDDDRSSDVSIHRQAWVSPHYKQLHGSTHTISTSSSSVERELTRIFGPDEDCSDTSSMYTNSQVFNESVILNDQDTLENKTISSLKKRPSSCDDRLLTRTFKPKSLPVVSFSPKVEDFLIEEYCESESTGSSVIDEEDRLNLVSPLAQQLAKDILEEALDVDNSDSNGSNSSSTPTNTEQSQDVHRTSPDKSPLHSTAVFDLSTLQENIT